MLSERRLLEIADLVNADHKRFGSAVQALVAVRLGLRDLLPEIERLRQVEREALNVARGSTRCSDRLNSGKEFSHVHPIRT
jgi:pyruvate/oxaloacetate carboxyltransferase